VRRERLRRVRLEWRDFSVRRYEAIAIKWADEAIGIVKQIEIVFDKPEDPVGFAAIVLDNIEVKSVPVGEGRAPTRPASSEAADLSRTAPRYRAHHSNDQE
jgi:hypothetical protein